MTVTVQLPPTGNVAGQSFVSAKALPASIVEIFTGTKTLALDQRSILLCGNSRSRIDFLALWSCDFEFPMEHCNWSAIS